MRSWHRPLGQFHPYGLAVVLIASFGLACLNVALVDVWQLAVAIAVLVGVCFGLAVGEVTMRQLWCAEHPTRNFLLPEWKGDGLPPPGTVLVKCVSCGRAGFVPAALASNLTGQGLCEDCAQSSEDSSSA